MGAKDIDREETYNSFLTNLSDFVEQNSDSESDSLLNELDIEDERYHSIKVVNQGGAKRIYRTEDPVTGRTVAKATLMDTGSEAKVENFLREARLTAALEHPNIVPVYDIGKDEKEGPYFIMKLVGGRNLGEIFNLLSKSDKELDYSLTDLMTIFLKICDAVSYAHSKGIVHLDLKPDNIQIGDYGEVLLCDWGLAKVLDQSEKLSDEEAELDPYFYNNLTLDGIIRGTPGYMAPEQIDQDFGPKDERTDIFALGGILYSLLCLKIPFESETLEGVIEKTKSGKLLPPSQRSKDRYVPASLEAVAVKALEIDRSNRYTSVKELREEIAKWMNGYATSAENAGFLKSLWLLCRRQKAASFMMLILLVSTVIAFYQIKKNERIALLNEQKAKRILDKFLEGKEFTEKLSEDVFEKVEAYFKNRLDNYDFDEALRQINETIRLYPESKMLNTFKGEVHFYLQEFSKASEAFSKAGTITDENLQKMIQLAPKYASLQSDGKKISATDLVELVFSFEGKYRDRIVEFMNQRISSLKNYRKLYNDPAKREYIDIHMKFCLLYNLKLNELAKEFRVGKGKYKNGKYNYRYTLSEDGIELDLSGSDLDNEQLFGKLPLKSLNVENTNFWRRWIFSHHSLKEVNIRNTYIEKLSRADFKSRVLKVIKITQEQFDASLIPNQTDKKILVK